MTKTTLTRDTLRTPAESTARICAMLWSGCCWIGLLGVVASLILVNHPKSICYWYDDEEETISWYLPDEMPEGCLDATDVPAEIRAEADAAALAEASGSGVATVFVILVYGGLFLAFFYLPTALALAYIRRNGMRLGPQQWPEFYALYAEAAERLGLSNPPPAYVIDADGETNAFAIKILRRRTVVFYAELIDRLLAEGRTDELLAVAGHELTHVALGHIAWRGFLLPTYLLPYASQYLSRCQERSADRGALYVCQNVEAVGRALLKLTLGVRATQHLNVSQYRQDSDEERGFLIIMLDLLSTHPATPDRLAALENLTVT